MKLGLIILLITGFLMANTYHDGAYVQKLKSWKKYYQLAGIAFVGLSTYIYINKYPLYSREMLSHANGMIKHMPIDKDSTDMLAPILEMAKTNFNGNNNNGYSNGINYGYSYGEGNTRQNNSEMRILNSGKTTKRSVSETKKKYVAAEQGWLCANCNKQLPAWFEVDHKIRLDSGGTNHIDNLVALCRDCHGKKTAIENL